MPWIYNNGNGNLILGGQVVGVGYSGYGLGKDNPSTQGIQNVGPIPVGRYVIGAPYDSEKFGPGVMHLTPHEDTETFGRGGFLIHGDSAAHMGAASHGCIVLSRSIRLQIAASVDRELEVV